MLGQTIYITDIYKSLMWLQTLSINL